MTVHSILGIGRARRIVVRFLFAATAALAIPAAMFAAPLPVSAATAFHMCESFGNYCVGSADLNFGTAVSERIPGRLIIHDSLGGFFDNLPTYLLRFNADPTKCVAAASNLSDVVIHACNGGLGVVWARDHNSSSGNDRWINREASQAKDTKEYLSGRNNGSQFFLAPVGQTGAFQRFNFVT